MADANDAAYQILQQGGAASRGREEPKALGRNVSSTICLFSSPYRSSIDHARVSTAGHLNDVDPSMRASTAMMCIQTIAANGSRIDSKGTERDHS